MSPKIQVGDHVRCYFAGRLDCGTVEKVGTILTLVTADDGRQAWRHDHEVFACDVDHAAVVS